MEKIRALIGCQNQECADEVSYPLNMMRVWEGKPICQECYEYRILGVDPDEPGDIKGWDELSQIHLSDLSE